MIITSKEKIDMVTGSSSGIGYETALLLARNGCDTYAAMRNMNKSKEIIDVAKNDSLPLQVMELDVTSDKSVLDAITKIAREKGRIDIVVNNAGYSSAGIVEDSSIDEIKAQFETNFFGAFRVMHAVIPIMRGQKSGIIVNISSIMAKIAFPLGAAYASSKFALEGLSESVRYEVERFGINVIFIEPGLMRTKIGDNFKIAKNAKSSDSSYAQLMQKILTGFESSLETAFPLTEVADVILKAVTSNNPEPRYLVGNDAVALMETRKNNSDKDFEKIMLDNLTS